MRRIAVVTPLYFGDESCVGGGERYAQNLAKGVVLASEGTYQVDLISFGLRPFEREVEPGVRLRVIQAATTPRITIDVLSWDLPATLADADLVHVHQSASRCGEVAVVLAKQALKPVCITDHGAYTSTLGRDSGLIELVDAVVAYSDFGSNLFHTKSTPVTVIKGGVDGSVFTPEETSTVRDRVLYVGRLLPHKGIDRLIEAMPPDLPLTVCGRPYHDGYLNKLKELAIGKCVEFLTDADDSRVIELYRRAWVNVLPSVYRDIYGNAYLAPELMGFTLLEAMACGTPAIASRVGAMPEFIREGETGFVFETVDELTRLLLKLAHDPALACRMGQRAREVVMSEYDLSIAGRSLFNLYETLIEKNQDRKAA